MTKEYKTTFEQYEPGGRYACEDEPRSASAPDPIEPDGEGWRLVSMAATDRFLFWSWERGNQ